MSIFRRLWEFLFGPKKEQNYTSEPIVIDGASFSSDYVLVDNTANTICDTVEKSKDESKVRKKKVAPVTLLASAKKEAKPKAKTKKSKKPN